MSYFHNQSTIVVAEPSSVESIFEVLYALNSQKMIILNTSRLKPDHARRFVDSLSSCALSLNGQTISLDQTTFIFTPKNFHIMSNKNNS